MKLELQLNVAKDGKEYYAVHARDVEPDNMEAAVEGMKEGLQLLKEHDNETDSEKPRFAAEVID